MVEKVILKDLLIEETPDLHTEDDVIYIHFHSKGDRLEFEAEPHIQRKGRWVNLQSNFDAEEHRELLTTIISASGVQLDLEYIVIGHIIYNLKDDIITVTSTTKIERYGIL